MAKAMYDYLMDKASDVDTYKAVMFASKMIRDGRSPSNAIRIASRYYDCDMSEVAKLVGQRGGRTNAEKRHEKAIKASKKKTEDDGKKKARELITKVIELHDGNPFFITHEEKKLSEETGYPVNWFRRAREQMREEGILDWETLKDPDGSVIGTWFIFK